MTGLPAERIVPVIQRDWVHLIRNQGLLDSPNYLREKQKPVVALWGVFVCFRVNVLELTCR